MKLAMGRKAARTLPKLTAVAAATIGLFLAASEPARADVSAATLRGHVAVGAQSAAAGAVVTATNVDTGYSAHTVTLGDGSYTLSSLPPGNYRIEVKGSGFDQKTQVVTLSVGEAVDLDLNVGAAGTQLENITIVGSNLIEMRTPEVATTVSRDTIEFMPQITRNFLSFAELAPGVRFNVDSQGYTHLQSGAQTANAVNIYIDGIGQKGDVLKGGLVGQDTSRGNPFPQSAIAEYKVVAQGYKAEYDQVSSVAISAVTKSGTNEFHGDAFWDHTSDSLTAKSKFDKANEANGVIRPSFKQDQYGLSVGGPIMLDRMHYFVSYEGKANQDPREKVIDPTLPNTGLYSYLRTLQGSTVDKFNEALVFAKFDLTVDERNRLELSAKVRQEKDTVPENASLSAPGNIKDRNNNETRLDLHYMLNTDSLASDAHLVYENSFWNPHPKSTDPLIEYKNASWGDIMWVGGSPDLQNKGQHGLTLKEDLAYTALPGHTIKGGVQLKALTLDMSGTGYATNHYGVLINPDGTPVAGQPVAIPNTGSVYPGGLNGYLFSAMVPSSSAALKDNQWGIYLQDDWRIDRHLEVNAGLRWDYESNMMNNSYVLPANIVADLNAPDTRAGAAPGQTYAQSLAKGGINISDFISTGSSRKPFTGAVAPRLGATYDLFGDSASVLFGGVGRAYDRNTANRALDELFYNSQPAGDIYLLRNNYKVPYSDQISLGFRQRLEDWVTEVAYTFNYSKDGFVYYNGNRNPDGTGNTSNFIDPLWGNAPNHGGNLVLGDFVQRARTDTLYLKADKPFTKESGWGVSVAWTYSVAKNNNSTGFGTTDYFDWGYPKTTGTDLHQSAEVERSRIIAFGQTDRTFGSGIMLAAKFTLGSGLPYQTFNCSGPCFYGVAQADTFEQLDISATRDFLVYNKQKLGVRLDVLNLLNRNNLGAYDQYSWDGLKFMQAQGVAGPMRTIKLGLRYIW
jgi:hypothetical protein